MPRQFGNLTYADYVPQYVGQDIQGITAIAKKAHDDYNSNIAEKDKLDIAHDALYSQVRPEDAHHVASAIDKAKSDLESISQSGRWEDAQPKLNRIIKDFATNPNLKEAIKFKAEKDKNIQDIQERVGLSEEKNGISQEDADNSIKYINNNLKNHTPVSYNSETHSSDNKFQPFSPVKQRDIGTRMFKIAEGWKADKTPITVTNPETGKQEIAQFNPLKGYFSSSTQEHVSEEEVSKALIQAIKANPDDMAYIEQQELFNKENTHKIKGTNFYRNVDNNDLAKVGMTKDKLEKLTSTKEIKDKDGKIIQEGKPGIDLNTLSPQEKEYIYHEESRNLTLANLTNPAVQKVSYNKVDTKHIADVFSREYLKDLLKTKHEKQVEKPTIDFGTETSSVNTLTEGDWIKNFGLEDTFDKDGKVKEDAMSSVATYGTQEERENPEYQAKVKKEVYAKKAKEAYGKLYDKAFSLGIVVDDKGKRPGQEGFNVNNINSEATKKAVMDYGNKLSHVTDFTPFTPTIRKNLSSDIFGKIPNIANMSFYEAGKEGTITNYVSPEQKEQFAKSEVRGLDYSSPYSGALHINAPILDKDKKASVGNKPFVAISTNKDLQDYMEGTQKVTNQALEFAKNGTPNKEATTQINNILADYKANTNKDLDLKQFGIEGLPSGFSIDKKTGDKYLSFNKVTENNTPITTVMVIHPNNKISILPLKELQSKTTARIFDNDIFKVYTKGEFKDNKTKVGYEDTYNEDLQSSDNQTDEE